MSCGTMNGEVARSDGGDEGRRAGRSRSEVVATRHVAVYPGSFDPFTVGHREVAERAGRLFGEVVVAVACDAEKEHLFSVAERVEMATDACRDLPNVRVDSFQGLVVGYALNQGAQALVKGLRAVSDFEREMQMDAMNRELAPGLDTLYLMATPAFTSLSSSLLKHVCRLGGDVSRFVTPLVLARLEERLRGNDVSGVTCQVSGDR